MFAGMKTPRLVQHTNRGVFYLSDNGTVDFTADR
jgi:hypothetical protein